MRRKNPWRDKDGNYLPSKSSEKFLDKLEMIFNCKIEREFKIQYGTKARQVRYYDGRYKNFLFELDGRPFHRTRRQLLNDKFKDSLAGSYDFRIVRLPLNSTREVDKVITENMPVLQLIFDEREFDGQNIIDKVLQVF